MNASCREWAWRRREALDFSMTVTGNEREPWIGELSTQHSVYANQDDRTREC